MFLVDNIMTMIKSDETYLYFYTLSGSKPECVGIASKLQIGAISSSVTRKRETQNLRHKSLTVILNYVIFMMHINTKIAQCLQCGVNN